MMVHVFLYGLYKLRVLVYNKVRDRFFSEAPLPRAVSSDIVKSKPGKV